MYKIVKPLFSLGVEFEVTYRMTNRKNTLQQFIVPRGVTYSEKTKLTCKTCKEKVKGSLKTTFNFYTHLKNHHPEIYETVTASDGAQQTDITSFISGNRSKYPPSHPKQIQLLNMVMNFISCDLMPLSTVESDAFWAHLTELDPRITLPSRSHIQSKLFPAKVSSLRNDVKKTISTWHNSTLCPELANEECYAVL